MKYFSKILSGALLAVMLAPAFAFAANPPVVTPTGVLFSATAYTANFKVTTAPSSATKLYASIGNVGTNSWIKRDIYLMEVSSSTPVSTPFDVVFNFADLGLADNTKYVYYIGDAPTPNWAFFTPPKCFTTTGTIDCSATVTSNTTTPSTTTSGTATNATTSGTTNPGATNATTAGATNVPNNPNTGTGSGTVSFSPTTTGTSVVTTTTTTSNATTTTQTGTDEDLGDNFLKNPLAPGLDTFPKIFAAVVNNIVLPIAVPFLAIMFIYSGFLFVEARGKPEKLTQAKEALKYTFIGAGLVLGAFVIANALQATVGQLLS